MSDELEELIARYPFWPQAPRHATPAQIARFAVMGTPSPSLTELREGHRLGAAVARVDLPWDTQMLGLRAARVVAIIPPPVASGGRELLARARADAVAAGYRYLFTRVDARDVSTVHHLEANGFRIVDALTMQYLRVAQAPVPGEVGGILVREAGPRDADTVTGISDACFALSRFHSDPLVGLERARAIYRAWVTNGLNGLNDLTLLATDQATGATAGFLTCKEISGTREIFGWGYCRIELVAVMEAFRGRNVVRALTRALLAAAPAHGWDLLGIGTQNANLQALRAYGKVGFAPGDATFSLRWRADDP